MSVKQGTLFARVVFRQASFKEDGEVIQGRFAMADGQRPFLGGFVDGHVDDLQGGLFVGVNLAVASELADHAVDRFDGVGGVDRPADSRTS